MHCLKEVSSVACYDLGHFGGIRIAAIVGRDAGRKPVKAV